VTASIIEQLAGQGWAVIPDFLPASLVSELATEVESCYQSGHLISAGTGQGQDKALRQEIRGDGICWLDAQQATPAQLDYLDRMEALRLEANRELQLGLFDLEAHFSRYPAGAFYRKHLDVFRADERRTLSVVCYLNKNWKAEEGGQLRLYVSDGQTVDVLPEGGKLACFVSTNTLHEVLPATRPRLSLTGWFRRR
jgi:SM-20-related protein